MPVLAPVGMASSSRMPLSVVSWGDGGREEGEREENRGQSLLYHAPGIRSNGLIGMVHVVMAAYST